MIYCYIANEGVIMNKEIKEKLEEIVALMNDTEITVMEKEVKEKLENILAIIDDPNKINKANEEFKVKLEKVVSLLNNAKVDPDIEIEYYPSIGSSVPYIMITYIVGDYNKPTRKIALGSTIMQNPVQEVVNRIISSVEEFKSEIDSVEMG